MKQEAKLTLCTYQEESIPRNNGGQSPKQGSNRRARRNFESFQELDQRYRNRREEDSDGVAVTVGYTTRDSSQKLSISTTACFVVLLVVVCFAISLALVLLVNYVYKSICPVRRSLRKTIFTSSIFLLIASTAVLLVFHLPFVARQI
nr:hypothetical protein DM860_000026 [Ipomoea batatas]